MYKVNKTYNTDILVDRFCDKYKSITGNSNSGRSRTVIKAPEIQSLNRKIYIKNFHDVCTSMNRDPYEVSTYISKELLIQTSISGNGALIIHGSYRKNQVESILIKYITHFVQCPLCKTQNTKIEKINRITYITCNKCHAQSAIS
jgi:translation initiation factor 2 subunit 2